MKLFDLLLSDLAHKYSAFKFINDRGWQGFDGLQWVTPEHLNFTDWNEIKNSIFKITNKSDSEFLYLKSEWVYGFFKNQVTKINLNLEEMSVYLEISGHNENSFLSWSLNPHRINSVFRSGQVIVLLGGPAQGQLALTQIFSKQVKDLNWYVQLGQAPKIIMPNQLVAVTQDVGENLKSLIELSFLGATLIVTSGISSADLALSILREHWSDSVWKALASQITFIETRFLPGLRGRGEYFCSYLPLSQVDKSVLDKNSTSYLSHWVESQTVVTDLLSLNQALIQGVIRRHIDLKTAFIASPDPDRLDEQLKRIGV